jgi:methylmalonyl-CoA/ethylmalonyl-CoA epimerase
MKIVGIDHIGVAAKSIDQVAPFWNQVLGLPVRARETVEEQQVTTLFLPVGEIEIEVLESTAPGSAVARFIESRGGGVQHLAFRVEDIDEALKELKSKGIRLIDETPRSGAGRSRIAFIHPKSTGGILIELVEHGRTDE